MKIFKLSIIVELLSIKELNNDNYEIYSFLMKT
jgi:hypothetical protein